MTNTNTPDQAAALNCKYCGNANPDIDCAHGTCTKAPDQAASEREKENPTKECLKIVLPSLQAEFVRIELEIKRLEALSIELKGQIQAVKKTLEITP